MPILYVRSLYAPFNFCVLGSRGSRLREISNKIEGFHPGLSDVLITIKSNIYIIQLIGKFPNIHPKHS